MNLRSSIYSNRLVGATLIEVLAGLAILGSVAVALLLARGRLLEQQVMAMRKIEGVQLADGLLAGWYAQDAGVPIDAEGEVFGHADWTWETQMLDTGDSLIGNAGVARLTLYGSGAPSSAVDISGEEPVVVVDLLVPGETP